MKTKELREVLESETLSIEDKIGKIMAFNGIDVNNAKANSSEENTKLQSQIDELTKKNQELVDQANKYQDYEELKKFKDDFVANQDKEQKLTYLKGIGFNHPELLLDKIDFTKGKYNAEKKTFEGLDDAVKGLKETYKDMYSEPQSGVSGMNPNGGQNTNNQMTGVEAAFYALNPSLRPKN